MKKVFLTLMVLHSMANLVACNKSSGGGSSPAPRNIQQPICPPGQVSGQAGCQTVGLIPSGAAVTYTASTGQQYTGYYSQQQQSVGVLNLSGDYRSLLKDAMGVCDRCDVSSGLASCQTWLSGYNDINIQTTGATNNSVTVTFRSAPEYDNFNTYWSSPNLGDALLGIFGIPVDSCYYGIQAPVLSLQMYAETHNNNLGFVLYGNGPNYSAWYGHTIRVFVDQGKLGDNVFDFRVVVYDRNMVSKQIANGRFQRR